MFDRINIKIVNRCCVAKRSCFDTMSALEGWFLLIGGAGWKPAVPGEFAHSSVTLLNLQRTVSSTHSSVTLLNYNATSALRAPLELVPPNLGEQIWRGGFVVLNCLMVEGINVKKIRARFHRAICPIRMRDSSSHSCHSCNSCSKKQSIRVQKSLTVTHHPSPIIHHPSPIIHPCSKTL